MRENFQCAACSASLRYRNQGDAILRAHGDRYATVAELVEDQDFRRLSIYEPGMIGPFRRLFERLPSYVTSYYWEDVEAGAEHDGVRCEDLEALTFKDGSFDLVISSDIFEHVRHPRTGFEEIYRVLRPGGRHIFTVPMSWPFSGASVARVDTSGPEDVLLLPAVYHGSPHDPRGSLVYTDFGMDLPDTLAAIGYRVLVVHGFRHAVTMVAERPTA